MINKSAAEPALSEVEWASRPNANYEKAKIFANPILFR